MTPTPPPTSATSAEIRRRAAAPEGTLGRRLTTLRLVARRTGARGLVALLVKRLLRPPLGILDWYVVMLNEHGPHPDPLPFRWARPEDADRLSPLGQTREEILRRLARNDRCAFHEQDGRVIAYAWFVTRGPWDDAGGVHVRVGPDQVWTYDVVVAPDHRGRGISPRLRRAAVADLALGGRPRALSVIDRLNYASLRASVKSGRPVARMLKLRVGPVGLLRVDDLRGGVRRRLFVGDLYVRIPVAPRPATSPPPPPAPAAAGADPRGGRRG